MWGVACLTADTGVSDQAHVFFKGWKNKVYVECRLPNGGNRGFQPGALFLRGRPRVHVTRRLPIPCVNVAVDSWRCEAKAYSRLQTKHGRTVLYSFSPPFFTPHPSHDPSCHAVPHREPSAERQTRAGWRRRRRLFPSSYRRPGFVHMRRL